MDYYSQRLSEKKKTKEARLSRLGLPLGQPNKQIPNGRSVDQSLRTMAEQPGQPQDPNAGLPNSDFKTVFDNLSSNDPGFKNGMAEFATIMKTMQKEMQGLNLPEEVMRKKVEQVVQKYQQGSRDAVMGSQQPQQPQQMGGILNG